ncbi:BlaI/MecI/CopY family transcriptional regulator [Undibacterium sp. FT79W]|uniref:BlaI/MecI/CopY family transcriptional regulator n=1 Tax=Undibacterium sp. FT79W TaxID=2762296 RepID=UPI00164A6C5E|nr:BlaI/MecI/CopY family transcriptional regulator [Undibacterium sp. FT79W]MBC3877033.1 BlaI/MecI/CopY family transcriptional regulator [Undibacterium sp. FT79W]
MNPPTPAELEILAILWRLGESKIQAVNDELCQIRPVGYTTTLKTMQIMEQKGLLGRRRDGRSHIYYPLENQQSTQVSLLERLLNSAFAGSKTALVMSLFGNQAVSKGEVLELKNFLDQLESSSPTDTQPRSSLSARLIEDKGGKS